VAQPVAVTRLGRSGCLRWVSVNSARASARRQHQRHGKAAQRRLKGLVSGASS